MKRLGIILSILLICITTNISLRAIDLSENSIQLDQHNLYYDYPFSLKEKETIFHVVKKVDALLGGDIDESKKRLEIVSKLYPLTGKDKYGDNEKIKAFIEELMIQILPKQTLTNESSQLTWLYTSEGNGLLDQSSIAYDGVLELQGYAISRNQITTLGYDRMMDEEFLISMDSEYTSMLPLFFIPLGLKDGLDLTIHPYLRHDIDSTHRYLLEQNLLIDQYKYDFYNPIYKNSIFIGCLDQFSAEDKEKLFKSSYDQPITIRLNYTFPHKYPYDKRMDNRGGPMFGWDAINYCINIYQSILVK